jgi:hypothetical protein
MLSLLLGAGVMSVLGAIGAALTVGLRRGGMLIALLVTPFYMPVLIFGAGAVQASLDGRPAAPYLALLGAMLCLLSPSVLRRSPRGCESVPTPRAARQSRIRSALIVLFPLARRV